MSNTPVIISIAGFDPSAGAGVLCDIKTVSSLGLWGMACITCNTVQTSEQFIEVQATESKTFEKTLKTLFDTYKINGLKIGLLTEKYQVDILASFIDEYHPKIIVIDPIIKSSTSFIFWDNVFAKYIMEKLFLKITAITPNVYEAKTLLSSLGECVDKLMPDELVINLYKKFRTNIALTNGDSITGKAKDIYYDGINVFKNETDIIELPKSLTHGTGCTFSSALLCYQVLGFDFIESCKKAAEYTKQGIKNALYFNKKQGGLNHYSK